MTNFDRILEACLDHIAAGGSTVDQCLAQHPQHRDELAPLLRAAEKITQLRSVEPSADFRQRGRRALEAHMRANPRGAARQGFWAQLFSGGAAAPRRLVTSALAVLFALVSTGTVLAQGALPGDPLYGWKLQTEQFWRPFSGEKTQYELRLSDRRAQEYLAVSQNPELATGALQDYTSSLVQLLTQLEMQPDQALSVYESLLNQQKALSEGGLVIPELDTVLRTLMPTETETPTGETPQGQSTGSATEQDQDEADSTDKETGSNSSGGQIDTLATTVPGLLQGVATAVAPILSP